MPVAYREPARRIAQGSPRPVRTRGGTLVLRKKAILGGLAAALLGMSAGAPHVVAAFGSTRTISFFHIHTKETLTITYKKDGKYDDDALKKINWIMRDWRLNQATAMDPKTIDLLWEMHTELGSKEPIHIICGYRSEKTNNMLRRTVGGQAKKSKHMTGQAIDATFPDIPLKQLRWSAAIREVGGIGYYPTSGVPFVHVDTGPVRAWPRLPRNELALLFPNGKTKHQPADGGSISKDDVRKARANKEVATQVAAYFEMRNNPSPVVIAEAPAPVLKAPPTPVAWPAPETRVAAVEAEEIEATPIEAPAPQLVQAPRPATPPPSEAERGHLDQLVTLASLEPTEIPAQRPQTAETDRRQLDELVSTASVEAPAPRSEAAEMVLKKETQVASLDPGVLDLSKPSLKNAQPEGWAPAPEFDEDHPEELSYRPFPVAPLLTQSASADDEALVKIVHPNLERTLDLLDDKQIVLPMRLRPGDQFAEVLWAQQFQGNAVDFKAHETDAARATGLTSRTVKTTGR
jgi:uncharacterized protein YcbK (DUF882 family)